MREVRLNEFARTISQFDGVIVTDNEHTLDTVRTYTDNQGVVVGKSSVMHVSSVRRIVYYLP